jgi:DNA-directed RNA polymerase specialized sigma24 family protein
MTIVEKLKEYRNIKAEIRAIELDIEELQDEDNIGPSAISYEEKTGKTNRISSQTEYLAISIADKVAKLEREKRIKERDIVRIENVLSILGEKEREVIEMKYMKGYKWDTISFRIDRSYQQCWRIEKRALEKIEALGNM